MTKVIEKYCLLNGCITFAIQYQVNLLVRLQIGIAIVKPFECCSVLIFGGGYVLIAI